jgi:hypothetical protein
MSFEYETLNIFINAFFALAAISAVLAATGMAMVLQRPQATRRPALELVRGSVREHPAMATQAPLPHERAA